jgi:FMN phosphatase YigB (HAD superfamily)
VKLSTVLLDAGGVLLDEAEMEESRAEATARILGKHVRGYSVARYWEDLQEAVQSHRPDAYLFVFRKHLGPGRTRAMTVYAEFLELWRPIRPPLKLMAGIDGEIRRMSGGFRLGIAGQYGSEILGLLEREGILDCFAWRFTQDDFSLTKPDPGYLQQIADACAVEPAECLMVGDRIDKDVVPARELGMKTIRIRVGLHKAAS